MKPLPHETIESLLVSGKKELSKLGREEAASSTEKILQDLLSLNRSSLYLQGKQPVSAVLVRKFQRLLAKRKARVPLAYLLKKAFFWNEELSVGPGCLTPRPETEILVECFIKYSGFEKQARVSFLDLCSGSGAIGIALLREFPQAKGSFIDCSAKALSYTRRNTERYGLKPRSEILRSHLFTEAKRKKWDAIVCNPPYISESEYKRLAPELFFEPKAALTAGKDGLDFYRKIAGEAVGNLNQEGLLVFEVGRGQARKVKALLEKNSFHQIRIFKDYSGIERVVMARRTN